MKKIAVIIVISICVIYLVSAPILGGFFALQEQAPRKDIFVELWHVDTFEGGKNSRGEFLKKVAVELNKKNKNEFVVVKTITEMELFERLAKGELPDMFSFGTGLGEKLSGYLIENNVGTGQREWLDESVKKDGKILATPYAFGGYFLIGNGNKIKVAEGTVLAPSLALYFQGEDLGKIQFSKYVSTYDAYLNFIEEGGKLIGTQRDVVRVSQRIENGKMNEVEIKPLGNFTDMVMAIGKTNKVKENESVVCDRYITYLLSENVQSRMHELRMFPARQLPIYSIPHFSQFEKDVDKMRCVNIFTPTEVLKKNCALGIKALDGDIDAKNFLNDFFIAK